MARGDHEDHVMVAMEVAPAMAAMDFALQFQRLIMNLAPEPYSSSQSTDEAVVCGKWAEQEQEIVQGERRQQWPCQDLRAHAARAQQP